MLFEPMRGIEPLTFSLPRKRSTPELHRLIPTRVAPCFDASGRRGSNSRPTAWKAVALPTELLPQNNVALTLSSGERRIRTSVDVSQQIYSLPHLAALVFPQIFKLTFSYKLLARKCYEPPVGIEPTTY